MYQTLLDDNLVFFDSAVATPDELFSLLETPLAQGGYINAGWKPAIEAREKDYPTGLVFSHIGIALPHVSADFIAKPYIAVVKPQTPVSFGIMASSDKVEAELILNLGMVGDGSQVKLLSRLMDIFSDADQVQHIKDVASAAELKQVLGDYL